MKAPQLASLQFMSAMYAVMAATVMVPRHFWGHSSGGQPEFIEPLARACVAAGVDAVFLEVHDNPAEALSDGANALPLGELDALLARLKQLSELVRGWGTA